MLSASMPMHMSHGQHHFDETQMAQAETVCVGAETFRACLWAMTHNEHPAREVNRLIVMEQRLVPARATCCC